MNQPLQPKNRIELLDVFRGFAVLGIFVVNIEIMNCIFMNQDAFSEQWFLDIDKVSVRILQLFFYSKFFPIFSFLFGLGITMQAVNFLEKKTLKFSFFARRMLGLFIIGLLHVVLFWGGDVVHLYAILGFLTTLLLKKSNRFVLILSAIFLVFPFYDQLGEFIFETLNFEPISFVSNYTSENVVETIRNAHYLDGMIFRINEYLANLPVLLVFLAPIALSMFLLGLYFGKNNFQQSLETTMVRLTKPAIIIALITNLYRVFFLFFLPDFEMYQNEYLRPFFFKGMFLSDIAMGLFYLWLLTWLWFRTGFKKLLVPLKYVGRMALTNYVMQSAIGLVLFSSLGFSLYQTLSPSQSILIALLVFVFQLVFSRLWLQYFKYGPLEWVWRCFSYGKILPIKYT